MKTSLLPLLLWLALISLVPAQTINTPQLPVAYIEDTAPLDVRVVEPLPELTGDPLRIGHLTGTDEIPIGPEGMQSLQRFLERDPDLQRALSEADRGQIRIIGTDDHEDLRLRMDSTSFDLVFAPTLIYLRQQGDYSVLGQIWSPDVVGTSNRTGLMQSAVIFVNSENPLFDGGEANAAELSRLPIGLVSASSATGFVFPLITMENEYGVAEQPRLMFQSSEDVVLAVLNNLVSIGACDETTYNRVVFEQGGGEPMDSVIRDVKTTAPIPVAPVVMRSDLMGTDLGSAIADALDRFLEGRGEVPLDLVQEGGDAPYARLARQVSGFYEESQP